MKNNNLKNEDNSINKIYRTSEAIAFYEENFDEDDDSQTMMSLHPSATQIDKMKYQLCEDIFDIKIRHKLSDEEVIKILKIDKDKIRQIKFSHYNEFNLEELTSYAAKLAESVEEEMITENKYVKNYQHVDHHIILSSSKSNNGTISMI